MRPCVCCTSKMNRSQPLAQYLPPSSLSSLLLSVYCHERLTHASISIQLYLPPSFFLSCKPEEMLMLTDHSRHHPPVSLPLPLPHPCVDVRGWQRSRADDCIHTSAHSQRSRQAERKPHILSARVFILVNCALSATIPVSERNMLERSLFWLFFGHYFILSSAP